MSFHITITDNDNGKTLRDFDTEAIIGGALNEEGAESIILAKCSDLNLAKAIQASEMGAAHVKKMKGPLFSLALAVVEASTTRKTTVDYNEENED